MASTEVQRSRPWASPMRMPPGSLASPMAAGIAAGAVTSSSFSSAGVSRRISVSETQSTSPALIWASLPELPSSFQIEGQTQGVPR